jgi:hypothetical protein
VAEIHSPPLVRLIKSLGEDDLIRFFTIIFYKDYSREQDQDVVLKTKPQTSKEIHGDDRNYVRLQSGKYIQASIRAASKNCHSFYKYH